MDGEDSFGKKEVEESLNMNMACAGGPEERKKTGLVTMQKGSV